MKKILIGAGVVLLAGCNLGGSDVSLQPGQWETKVRFTDIQVPGAPEAELAALRQAMGEEQTQTQCLTQEQAANPAAGMLAPMADASCDFSERTFAGGDIRIRGTCNPPQQGRAEMEMEGSYTATTMETQITINVTAPPGTEGPQSMRMAGTSTARRTGDCPAG